MKLYEMLSKTLYFQRIRIYETNAYDQNLLKFEGIVNEARCDENVWDYLMYEVDRYECNTGLLLLFIKSENYEDRFEDHYFYSEKWGEDESERPWKHYMEIERGLEQ